MPRLSLLSKEELAMTHRQLFKTAGLAVILPGWAFLSGHAVARSRSVDYQ